MAQGAAGHIGRQIHVPVTDPGGIHRKVETLLALAHEPLSLPASRDVLHRSVEFHDAARGVFPCHGFGLHEDALAVRSHSDEFVFLGFTGGNRRSNLFGHQHGAGWLEQRGIFLKTARWPQTRVAAEDREGLCRPGDRAVGEVEFPIADLPDPLRFVEAPEHSLGRSLLLAPLREIACHPGVAALAIFVETSDAHFDREGGAILAPLHTLEGEGMPGQHPAPDFPRAGQIDARVHLRNIHPHEFLAVVAETGARPQVDVEEPTGSVVDEHAVRRLLDAGAQPLLADPPRRLGPLPIAGGDLRPPAGAVEPFAERADQHAGQRDKELLPARAFSGNRKAVQGRQQVVARRQV